MGGDDYVTINVTIRKVTGKAVLVWVEGIEDDEWVPRSCLHAADDRVLDAVEPGQSIILQVREWKARQAGLI